MPIFTFQFFGFLCLCGIVFFAGCGGSTVIPDAPPPYPTYSTPGYDAQTSTDSYPSSSTYMPAPHPENRFDKSTTYNPNNTNSYSKPASHAQEVVQQRPQTGVVFLRAASRAPRPRTPPPRPSASRGMGGYSFFHLACVQRRFFVMFCLFSCGARSRAHWRRRPNSLCICILTRASRDACGCW